MSRPKLTSLTVERFKSFDAPARLDLAPLTVILGRNNSGKSTLIQSLLLLKQTLHDPRPDVMLKLEGVVEAFNLRELTFNWPAQADVVGGPTLTLEWESEVDVVGARDKARQPDLIEVSKNSQIDWLTQLKDRELLRTKITLCTREIGGVAQISEVKLWSKRLPDEGDSQFDVNPLLAIACVGNGWKAYWRGIVADELSVELQHFLPFLLINRRNLGPRSRQRAWHNAYLILFEQPLADLEQLLTDLHFLGSSRVTPPTFYKAATAAPSEVGVSGELAAQLLHRRQHELVHFLPPLEVDEGKNLKVAECVRARPMVQAVNEVMAALSIHAPIRIQDIEQLGFRLMFGEASLMHVGRGLNSLLPLVELGLFADPLRFTGSIEDLSVSEYRAACQTTSHICLEEPEAHLHPKVASRLAHWLVSLAMTNRQVMVETHSDHFVRRLRGLVARAGKGTPLEAWLLENVAIVSVDQKNGRSVLEVSKLTAEGGMAEKWPTDFMDTATEEESAIFYAKLEKEPSSSDRVVLRFEEGEEPEVELPP